MSDLQMTAAGVEGRLISPVGEGRFRSPLLGRFNLMNLLQAVGVLLQQQLPLSVLLEAIGRFGGVPGRMERVILNGVDAANLPLVLVDYAHTPDGLDNALSAARPFCAGRLICVFGCGGDRDPGKRPEMAKEAEKRADYVIVTDDNPRTEQPERIVSDISAGFTQAGRWQVIHDRAQAIAEAVGMANEDDLVLIAGKGHEAYQEIRGQKLPFSDAEQVRHLLNLNGGVA